MTCRGFKRNGEPCRAAATKGSKLCFFHGQPDEAARLGGIGGRKNRRAADWSGSEFAELSNAKDVRVACGKLADEVRSGIIDPKTAMAIKGLLTLQFEASKQENDERYEERLATLEKQLRIVNLREALTPPKQTTDIDDTDGTEPDESVE